MSYEPKEAIANEPTILIRPLIPITLAMGLGIWIGSYFPGFFFHGIFLVVGLCLGGLWQVRQCRPTLLLPLLLCVTAGYTAIQPWVRADLPADHVIRFVDQGQWRVIGTVVEAPDDERKRPHFILQARFLEQARQRHLVCGRIAVSTRDSIGHLAVGDRISLEGRLHAIRSFCNPGGFDYARFMALKGIRARLFARPESVTRISAGVWKWRRVADRIRDHISFKMDRALEGHGPDTIGVLKALTIGRRDGIRPDLKTAFNRSGVAHVLAISGLHIGMVAVAAYALGFWLSAWVPGLVQSWLGGRSSSGIHPGSGDPVWAALGLFTVHPKGRADDRPVFTRFLGGPPPRSGQYPGRRRTNDPDHLTTGPVQCLLSTLLCSCRHHCFRFRAVDPVSPRGREAVVEALGRSWRIIDLDLVLSGSGDPAHGVDPL